jgi:hypothetical protein
LRACVASFATETGNNLEARITMIKALAIASALLLLVAASAFGQDTQVTASISSDTVGVQDQLQLSITVSGKDSGDAEPPRVQNVKGFRVVSGPNVSSQFQWINGRTSSTKSFIYVLIPDQEGQFTIDPVEIRVAGKTYRTQPLQVRVTSAAPRGSPLPRQRSINPIDPFDQFDEEEDRREIKPASDAVIVRAELDRNSAYPGQQVTLSYKVYTQVSISGFQLRESPPLSGFWVEDLEVERVPKGTRQVVNGREYLVFTVKKQALFATTTGTLKIPSSVFAVSAETGRGFFGAFGRSETLYRKTPELSLSVKPLPVAGRPPAFNNAVGSFSLDSSIDKTQVATGDAVALRIKLEGQGNLKMIPDIPTPVLPDFTVYSSKRADTIRPAGGDQIGGNKTWEFVIVPKAPGRQTIPSIAFSFFHATQEKYQTVATPALSLNVVRGGDAFGGSSLSGRDKQDIVRRGTDINFIKLSPDNLQPTGTPFYSSVWIFLIATIPLALNAGIIAYQRRHIENLGNITAARSRRAKRIALQRLNAAEKRSRSDPRRFYDETELALSGYLSDKFNLTGIELTGDNLERALTQNSVPRETVEETMACLQDCDFGRFVSASASEEKMRGLTARIRTNIEILEKIRLIS